MFKDSHASYNNLIFFKISNESISKARQNITY